MPGLLERFVDTSLPAGQFHHEQHVQVAWLFVRRYGMPAALGEFTAAIKRFAEAKGAHGLYHETITWAFLLLVAERQARTAAETWEEFAAANADLLAWQPSILNRYYSKELLASELARGTFLMPDLGRTEVRPYNMTHPALVIFDMAGTTVEDRGQVPGCLRHRAGGERDHHHRRRDQPRARRVQARGDSPAAASPPSRRRFGPPSRRRFGPPSRRRFGGAGYRLRR